MIANTMSSSHQGEKPKSKKIIICCDGTACTAFKGDEKSPPTNVSRIARCIKPISKDNVPQLVHYIPGIGSGDENELNPVNWYNLGSGRGVEEKIIEAYTSICHNYKSMEDQIVLVGFSRGAFIARCVADLVSTVGVLSKFGLYYVRDIYDMWREDGENREKGIPERYFATSSDDNPEDIVFYDTGDYDQDPRDVQNPIGYRVDREKLAKHISQGDKMYVTRGVQIEVCALWDTVGALGPILSRMGIFRPSQNRRLNFIRSELSKGVKHTFQALSLHDRRRSFLPIVLQKPTQDRGHLEQCWFVGYHGDVGGGTRGEGLAQFSLAWMIARLRVFVDMDLKNFWNPRLRFSNWRVDEDGGSQINPKDTLTSIYRLGGAQWRKPGRQFWTQEGFKELSRARLDNYCIESELMHFSVRLLIDMELMKRCECLRNATMLPDGDGNVTWHLPIPHSYFCRFLHWIQGKTKATEMYAVKEVALTGPEMPWEVSLLRKWVDSELKILQSRTSKMVPRGPSLAKLKAELDGIRQEYYFHHWAFENLAEQGLW